MLLVPRRGGSKMLDDDDGRGWSGLPLDALVLGAIAILSIILIGFGIVFWLVS
jgi:hypothetical protein